MPLTRSHHGHIAMLAFSALVAGSFSLGARAAPHVDPAVLSALRLPLAAALLALAAQLSGGMNRRAFQSPWRALLLGGLMAAYFVLMFEGLKTAAPVQTAAVFTLTPLMAAGFGYLTMRQRLTGRMALALGIGGLGALWVIFRGDPKAVIALDIGKGEMIYFLACALHALYAALVPKLSRGEGALMSSCATMAAGGVILLLWTGVDLWHTDFGQWPMIVWLTLIYVTIFATAMTTFAVQFAALRLPASKVMAYTYLVPSWVILWEMAFGANPPPLLVGGGVVLTCIALVLLLKD